MKRMKKLVVLLLCFVIFPSFVFAQGEVEEGKPEVVLKYAHMNAVDNTSGIYAQYFADRVFELTDGAVKVDIYPNSQLGSIQEMAEMVSTGAVQIHHNTWGGLSVLLEKLELMDTPYLTTSVEDSVKLNDVTESPILQDLNQELIDKAGVRVLVSIYGGSRMLTTASFPVYSPADLKGVKIRAIPSKIYITAVEGMGAIPVSVDWADVPAALATGVAEGQENPPTTINAAKLYETQKFLMETRHIIGVGPTVINENAYQALKPEYQDAIDQAAYETGQKFTQHSIEAEKEQIENLINKGMTFITEEDGLKIDEFKASVDALVKKNYAKYSDYYSRIRDYLNY